MEFHKHTRACEHTKNAIDLLLAFASFSFKQFGTMILSIRSKRDWKPCLLEHRFVSATSSEARMFTTTAGFYRVRDALLSLASISLWYRPLQEAQHVHMVQHVDGFSLILATSTKVTSKFADFTLGQKDVNMWIYVVFNDNCQKWNLLRGFSRENVDILPGFTQGQEKSACVCVCV